MYMLIHGYNDMAFATAHYFDDRDPSTETEAWQNWLECGISQLKRNRAVTSRYEKLAVRYLATIRIAAINKWLPRHL
jgi:abortive infection bacteriophage resistance protein